MSDCEGCRKRREAIIAAGLAMASWLKNPIGRPPLDLSQRPQTDPDQTKTETGG